MRLVAGRTILELAGILKNIKSCFPKRKYKITKYEKIQFKQLKNLLENVEKHYT